jgi:hypothetical protein
MGYFLQRIGMPGIINFLKSHEATAELMEKATPLKAFMEVEE